MISFWDLTSYLIGFGDFTGKTETLTDDGKKEKRTKKTKKKEKESQLFKVLEYTEGGSTMDLKTDMKSCEESEKLTTETEESKMDMSWKLKAHILKSSLLKHPLSHWLQSFQYDSERRFLLGVLF